MALFFTFNTQKAKGETTANVLCSAWRPEASLDGDDALLTSFAGLGRSNNQSLPPPLVHWPVLGGGGNFAKEKFWWTNFVTRNSHQIFRVVLIKPTKFFRREICPLRNLLATKFFLPPVKGRYRPGGWSVDKPGRWTRGGGLWFESELNGPLPPFFWARLLF